MRLQPLRTVGETRGIPPLVETEQPVEPDEPVVVLTYGRTRLLGLPRFLKASAGAEAAVLGAPGLLASTGFARPPRIISTFSVWRTVTEMRDYVTGGNGPGHVDAVRGNAERGFHHDSLFARFRPYATAGRGTGATPRRTAAHAPGRPPSRPSKARLQRRLEDLAHARQELGGRRAVEDPVVTGELDVQSVGAPRPRRRGRPAATRARRR